MALKIAVKPLGSRKIPKSSASRVLVFDTSFAFDEANISIHGQSVLETSGNEGEVRSSVIFSHFL